MKIILTFAFVTCLSLFLLACAKKGELTVQKDTFLLDTAISIKLYGTKDAKMVDECFSLVEKYENLFSRTIPSSDVSKLNSAGGKFVEVAPETYEILEICIKFAELSDGAFDPTVGIITPIWDFRGDPKVPTELETTFALENINYKNIKLKTENNQKLASLTDADVKIDLGGIAKGFITDKVRLFLAEKGIESAILDLGGNVYAMGSNSGENWRIGIRDPNLSNELIAKVFIMDLSVVTSGVYERNFTENSIFYHHLLDPKTAFPAKSDILSVSIISDSSATADALSTACFVLGVEKGLALVNSIPNTNVFFVESDGNIVADSGLNYEDLSASGQTNTQTP